MDCRQRLMAIMFFLLLVALVVLTITGELVNAAVGFIKSLDALDIGTLTVVVISLFYTVATLLGSSGIIGLAAGFVYGRRLEDPYTATAVGCAVAIAGILPGYLTCFAFGRGVLLEWAKEFQQRNPLFAALDTVIVKQGLKVVRSTSYSYATLHSLY